MARDYFHPIVKAALIKEGWTVNYDPLELNVGGVDMEIDLGAEQVIGAERQGVKIAIEIKKLSRKRIRYFRVSPRSGTVY